MLPTLKTPFEVHGASNVFLETVKRGDDDKYRLQDSEETVILRLYEAYGGHGQATLKVASHISVREAYVTNLLEDEGDQLNILRADDTEHKDFILHHKGKPNNFQPFASHVIHLDRKRESWVTVDKARLF
jgi:alpha-mannosidase